MGVRELTTEQQVFDLINAHNQYSTEVVLDLETTGLNVHTDTITDIVIEGIPDSKLIFIIHPKFVDLLKYLEPPVVCHNFKFDFKVLHRYGIDLRQQGGLHYDTMLLDHLINENNLHKLDEIVKRRYNDDYKEIFWNKYKNYTDATREDQLSYMAKDVYYTRRILNDSLADLDRLDVPKSFLSHVHRLALSLYDTELIGIKIDVPYLSDMGEDLTKKIAMLDKQMRSDTVLEIDIIETEQYLIELEKRKTEKGKLNVKRPIFNFDSSKQLQSLLYTQLNLPIQLNPSTKKPTTDDNALEKLKENHKLIPSLREYKGYQKVYTSFIEGTLEKMYQGRIYPSFNINGTDTGRISSSEPNLQQLPSEGGVRGIYIPEEGYVFFPVDFQQIEVCIAAHFSQDKNLLKILFEGVSQHDITAQALNVPRSVAKTINFALQYGAGIHKIQKILNCSLSDAQVAYDNYWKAYSGLKELNDRCKDTVERGLPIVNLYGRRRNLPTKKDLLKEYGERSFFSKTEGKRIFMRDIAWNGVLRQSTNSLIQGTAADICHEAFYTVDQELRKRQIGKAVIEIHDEILVMCKKDKYKEASQITKELMIGVGKRLNLTVPLNVSVGKSSERWEK